MGQGQGQGFCGPSGQTQMGERTDLNAEPWGVEGDQLGLACSVFVLSLLLLSMMLPVGEQRSKHAYSPKPLIKQY